MSQDYRLVLHSCLPHSFSLSRDIWPCWNQFCTRARDNIEYILPLSWQNGRQIRSHYHADMKRCRPRRMWGHLFSHKCHAAQSCCEDQNAEAQTLWFLPGLTSSSFPMNSIPSVESSFLQKNTFASVMKDWLMVPLTSAIPPFLKLDDIRSCLIL